MTRDRDLIDGLSRAAAVDPAARERSWRVVQAACSAPVARPPRRRRHLGPLLAAAALALVAAVGATAAATPHSPIGHWVRNVLGTAKPPPHPAAALLHIPGGGRLLVQSDRGTWVVSPDGHRRRLGAYDGAAWSPRGLFVVAWRGRQLAALKPSGSVRWTLSAPGPIAMARWAPGDGFRIAYLVGGELRIVNGDGTGDHVLEPARAGVAPAWRPGADHVLAYLDRSGRVNVVAVDGRRFVGHSALLGRRPARLTWSPGGRRLIVVTATRIVVLSPSGHVLASRAVPPTVAVRAIAWSPRGGQIAMARAHSAAGGGDVVLLDSTRHLRQRTLFSGPGGLGDIAWSPDGARLLIAWPAADEWLFVGTRAGTRTQAVAGIARQFAPGAQRPPFPGAAQWCCAR